MTKAQSLLTALSVFTLGIVLTFSSLARAQTPDPLPSWNEGQAKQSIINFVTTVTKQGSPDFVDVKERIATFDNDGNLWAEQPMYFQLFFAIDRVKELAPRHPEWKTEEPFASLLRGQFYGRFIDAHFISKARDHERG